MNNSAILHRQRGKRRVNLLVFCVPIRELQSGGFDSITLDPPTPTELSVGDFSHDLWIDIHLCGPVIRVSQALSIKVVFTQIVEGKQAEFPIPGSAIVSS